MSELLGWKENYFVLCRVPFHVRDVLWDVNEDDLSNGISWPLILGANQKTRKKRNDGDGDGVFLYLFLYHVRSTHGPWLCPSLQIQEGVRHQDQLVNRFL